MNTPKLPPLPHWCEEGSPFAQQMQAYALAAIEALRAQIGQHEPLACAQVVSMNDVQGVVEWLPHHGKPIKVGESLYSAPQQQPLTDEQIDCLLSEWLYIAPGRTYEEHRPFARAVERAHGIGEKK